MSWKRVESSVRPAEIDKDSSKKFVYVNKNVTEETRTDESGQEMTMYVFDQNKILQDDWDVYESAISAHDSSEQNKADIAYVAIMTGVEL